MKNIGYLLVFFGAGSVVLNVIGREFILLAWVDNWGETMGWVIRGAMIVVGGIMLLLAKKPVAAPLHVNEPHVAVEEPHDQAEESSFQTETQRPAENL